jgi:hypothetical protein
MNRDDPPNIGRILSGLKDFQRDTVDYVFRRLYLDNDLTHRFLVADEVGLGKTLVARGVIAKAVEHLWNLGDRIDIIYICSNADIARQNISRLNITGGSAPPLASRITLLPLHIRELGRRRLNFVSFTPGTSFEQRAGLGIRQERALIYWLLHRAWQVAGKAAARNVLAGRANAWNFEWEINNLNPQLIDESIAKAFWTVLTSRPKLRERFDRLCDVFSRSDARSSADDRKEQRDFVAEMRALLASVCLHALKPDLIILDEFQRFKRLLSDSDEASRLAQELFSYSSENRRARVLLLSATPYKMLSLYHEEEDHYQDFRDTLSFLEETGKNDSRFKPLLESYRSALFGLRGAKSEGIISLVTAKAPLEAELKKVMVRTERLASESNRVGMLSEIASGAKLASSDVASYLGLQRVADVLEQGNSMEYWKSAPYALNFMDDYQLKSSFKRSLKHRRRSAKLARTLRSFPEMLLSWNRVENYQCIEPQNSRLRPLIEQTLDSRAWKLLWIAPSLPYYRLRGAFADPVLQGFTKRLVFSSWRVVPKAVSCLVTYEAERRSIRSFEKTARNTAEARKRRRPLLRFSYQDQRLTGLPLFCLVYPCATLAEECDPRAVGYESITGPELPSAQETLKRLQEKIGRLLQKLNVVVVDSARADETWYWAAPILFDLVARKSVTLKWWQRPQLAEIWVGDEEESDPEDTTENRWSQHVDAARELLKQYQSRKLRLGPAPADLIEVLAEIAAAAPATAALRALSRATTGVTENNADAAASIGRAFLSLFNLPETMAIVRGIRDQEPFWRRVLEYCVDGGLQAVLDEYIHLLRESLGLLDVDSASASNEIARTIVSALTLRTSSLGIDRLQVSGRTVELSSQSMRGRFAMRFGEEKDETGAQVTRADRVRTAFNSPFWPFVLTTTSVGQEGLDFHHYCHSVVHWNLPSNPVDLEQREGRVHRYKGHAVRRNIALQFGAAALRKDSTDPWRSVFDLARGSRGSLDNDLFPYWVFPGEARIERHVPTLPLSREVERLEYLRRALMVYRMAFGQSRQEDLISYLLANIPPAELEQTLKQVVINLAPPGR